MKCEDSTFIGDLQAGEGQILQHLPVLDISEVHVQISWAGLAQ